MGSIDRFFDSMRDDERCCYLRVSRLKEAVRLPKVLDALLDQLQVPGKSSVLRKLSDDEKFDAIRKQMEHFSDSSTSLWRDSRGGEILAASIWLCQAISNKFVGELFSAVSDESDLLDPVTDWLKRQDLEVHAEIPMGKKRADVVGHRPPTWGGLRGRLLIGIELKDDVKEMERGIDQMSTYADYAHRVYLACTPAMAAKYLLLHAGARGVKHWDGAVLDRKLQKLGFGLLLVEGNDVFEHSKPPRDNQVLAKNVDEVLSAFNAKTRVHQ